jgi:hypothetical protein
MVIEADVELAVIGNNRPATRVDDKSRWRGASKLESRASPHQPHAALARLIADVDGRARI